MARFCEICVLVSIGAHTTQAPLTYHALALLHINLVSDHDLAVLVRDALPTKKAATHKREAFRIHRTCLHKELIAPAVQRVEALGVVHIVHQHTAIGPTVKSHA